MTSPQGAPPVSSNLTPLLVIGGIVAAAYYLPRALAGGLRGAVTEFGRPSTLSNADMNANQRIIDQRITNRLPNFSKYLAAAMYDVPLSSTDGGWIYNVQAEHGLTPRDGSTLAFLHRLRDNYGYTLPVWLGMSETQPTPSWLSWGLDDDYYGESADRLYRMMGTQIPY